MTNAILKHFNRSKRGVALIAAMYTMIILAALGTFFIADMISKSRTLSSYGDSKLALQMANTGTAFATHYLGELYNKQYQSCLASGNCPTVWSNSYTINTTETGSTQGVTFSGVTFKLSPVITSGQNRTYSLTLPAGYLSNEIAPGRKGSFVVTIDVKLKTPSPDINDIYSVEYMEFTSIGIVYANNGTEIAKREVVLRTRRSFGLSTALYQNWNGWDLPGAAPPNSETGTDMAGGVGDNFLFKGVALSGGDSPYAKSTAGTIRAVDQDGNSSNNAKFLGATLLNGSETAQKNVGDTTIFVGPAIKYDIDTISLPTGDPFGPADGSKNTAPSHMKRLYELASADGTVFITPSDTQGEVKGDGTDSNGYLVEKFQNTNIHHKPGFAITDISFDRNSRGKSIITVKRVGYYSGKEIYSTTIDPTNLQNGIIYVQGGNVRVHNGWDYKNNSRNTAGLSEGRVTIAANQGEAFYNSSGSDITPTNLSGSSRYMSNENGSQKFSDGGLYANGRYIIANPTNTNDSNYNRTIFISPTDYTAAGGKKGEPVSINGKWWWQRPSELHPSNINISEEAGLSQFAVSEGNITITGDLTYQQGDDGAALGLIARNYLIIADKDANKKNTTDFNGDGVQNDLDRQLTIQASMLSTNHSLQWEGSTVLNSNVPGDSFVNQDFYFNPNKPQDVIDPNNTTNPITPLLGATQAGKSWPLFVNGTITAPFIDVEGDTSGNGYLKQQYSFDSNIITDLPPGFPKFSFSQIQEMSSFITIKYTIINYTDKGALKEQE